MQGSLHVIIAMIIAVSCIMSVGAAASAHNGRRQAGYCDDSYRDQTSRKSNSLDGLAVDSFPGLDVPAPGLQSTLYYDSRRKSIARVTVNALSSATTDLPSTHSDYRASDRR